MNFAGPFDSELSHVSPVSLGGDGFTFGKPSFIQHHPSDSHVVIPDAHLLFSGDYTRIGSDLIISGNGQKIVVGNYFKGETRPALTSKDGATLAGHIVDALTGHVHYAQANTAAPAAGQVIGNVLKLSGSATAIRNGVSIELHIGDAIQKGDVIQTGSDSSIGMTFVDGSAFGMTSNARMVMNEMIYDPNGSSNSSLISLVQGTITFVAGQTAKNGNMRVETPVATMGIRGTAVLVEIGANDGPTKFSVLVEPDGHTGSYNLYDKATGQLIGTVSQAGQVTYVTSLGLGQPPSAIEQLKTLQDQQNEKSIIQQVFQLFFPNYNPDDSNPKSPKFGHNTSGNNLAEIIFTTNSNKQQTFLTQIELRFAVTDPLTGITTYQNKIFYNSKASFSADSVFGNQAFVSTTETFKFADVVKIDDPDIGNAPFYDIGVPFVAGSAIIKSAVSTTTAPDENVLKNLLVIDQVEGKVSYDPHAFNFLDDGETVTYVIRVLATSGPDSALVDIHVTINGANDVPVFGAPVAVDLHEIGIVPPATLPPTGGSGVLQKDITLHFTDADFSETGTSYQVQVTDVHTTGSTDGFDAGTLQAKLLSFFNFASTAAVTKDVNSTDGYIHGTFSADDKSFDYLADGQQLVITYRVQLTEGDYHNQHYYQDFTVTITGSNDVPTIAFGENSQADTIYELPGLIGGTTFDHNAGGNTPSGSIHFADVDLTDRPTAVITTQDITYLSADGNSDLSLSLTQGQRSAIEQALQLSVPTGPGANTNNGVVNWTYNLVDNVLDFLAEDETITLVSTVRISDGHGGFVDATVTINIVGGANDTPSISAISDVGLDEPTNAPSLHQDIAVNFTDVDLSDTGHQASVQSVTATGVVPPSTPAGALTSGALFGLLTAVSAEKAAGVSAGSASFSFDAASGVFDYLADGEKVVLTYTVGITDPHGATGTQTVKVTITGTNDVPVFTSQDLSGNVIETDGAPAADAASLTDSGIIKFTDVDLSDTHAVSATGTFVPENTGDVALGTLTAVLDSDIDHTTGLGGQVTWTYSVDPAKVEYLAAGEHLTETFTITIDDGTSTPIVKTISVDIAGTNDVPVIAGDVTGNVTEDTGVTSGHIVTDGDLTITDADHDQSAFVAQTSAAGNNGYGAFTLDAGGHWTYTADNSQVAIQQLGAHDTLTDSFTAHSLDGTADQLVTVTIHGTNDAPVMNVDNVLPVEVDGNGVVNVSGITVSDIDAGSDAFTVTAVAVNGTVTTADGHSLNPADTDGGFTGTFDEVTALFTDGAVYTPSYAALTDTDKVTLTVADNNGGTDTVNFIFKQYATGGVTLEGTAGKDWILSSTGIDTMTGGAGHDNFVFVPSSGQDTITDFTQGDDKIDLHMLTDGPTATSITNWLETAAESVNGGSDTLLHLNGTTDTVLVKGVAALNASDFILHA